MHVRMFECACAPFGVCADVNCRIESDMNMISHARQLAIFAPDLAFVPNVCAHNQVEDECKQYAYFTVIVVYIFFYFYFHSSIRMMIFRSFGICK